MRSRFRQTSNLGHVLAIAGFVIVGCAGLLAFVGCDENEIAIPDDKNLSAANDSSQQVSRRSRLSQFKPSLADYEVFQKPINALIPAQDVIEYELNTPLFTDYAQKQRLIKLPPHTSMTYQPEGPFDFPVGTVIAKTFYYADDLSDPNSNRQLIETRILEHREEGWIGIPYVWNDEQTEARLAIAGATVDVAWMDNDGQSQNNAHVVPNLNDCKRCHAGDSTEPIGPQAHNLNRNIELTSRRQNQLAHWAELKWLTGLPELQDIPKLAVWNDASDSIDDRARAYLEVNCAHCHHAAGPARNSGLHLNVEETQAYRLGKFKTPVAAGKGTGGRIYGIVPGKPDESIMEYRMGTTKPGEIMPEFGKSLVHKEGLALIRQWIQEMEVDP